MTYYNNRQFADNAYAIGKEYKSKLAKVKTRKKRIDLALKYYDRFLHSASKNNIALECHNDPDTKFVDYLLFLIKKHNIKSVLDYGCAEGNLLENLYKKNKSIKYFGIDFGIYTKRKNNFKYLTYDKNYLIPDSLGFDLIISHHVVEHIHPKDLDAHLKDVRSHLNSKGIYFMSLPSKSCSMFWDTKVIDNFHLGQYLYKDLDVSLKRAGFSSTKRIFFNIKYFPNKLNLWTDLAFGKNIERLKNKYIYGLFNLLTLRIVAYK